MEQHLGDQNMEFARHLAEQIGPPPELPASLEDPAVRAALVKEIDGPFIPAATDPVAFRQEVENRLNLVAQRTAHLLPDVSDAAQRVNIALRLWSGCLSAAKTIALETRSGPNNPEGRAKIMAMVDEIARRDPIYASGVEAAPAFKRGRGQPYSLEGVVADSIVRRFA